MPSNVLHTFSRSVITLLLDKMYEALLSVTPVDIGSPLAF